MIQVRAKLMECGLLSLAESAQDDLDGLCPADSTVAEVVMAANHKHQSRSQDEASEVERDAHARRTTCGVVAGDLARVAADGTFSPLRFVLPPPGQVSNNPCRFSLSPSFNPEKRAFP